MSWIKKAAEKQAVKFLVDVPNAEFYAYDGSEDENGWYKQPIKAGEYFELGSASSPTEDFDTADTGGSFCRLSDFVEGKDYVLVPMAEWDKAIELGQ